MEHVFFEDLRYILTNTLDVIKKGFCRDDKIFITGATGFFGKWLLESLDYISKELDLNLTIYALSRNPGTFLEKYPYFSSGMNINWIEGDIQTFKFKDNDFSYIIHCATEADAYLNINNPILMLDTIINGTKQLLEFSANQKNLKGLLLTSSGAIYGRPPKNISSNKEFEYFGIDITDISSAYSMGKSIAELYGFIYAKKFNLPVKIVRCFAFVGPYLPLNKHFAIGNFINDGLNERDIVIHGNGTHLRSYMYSSDLMIWLLTILIKGRTGEVYNVGSDSAISIRDLAILINNFFPNIRVKILNQVQDTDRNLDYVPNVEKAKMELNLNLGVSLYEAVNKTIQFYNQKK
jgi:dTDP-glucose 4,6-dehydratase